MPEVTVARKNFGQGASRSLLGRHALCPGTSLGMRTLVVTVEKMSNTICHVSVGGGGIISPRVTWRFVFRDYD